MKLGIGYLIFSGAEFLKPSLLQVRQHAHYIVGMYSLMSNDGFPAPAYLEPLMKDLKKQGLFDEIIQTEPVEISSNPVKHQYLHRVRYEQGKMFCHQNGCTHYMISDCDEFYDCTQFGKFISKTRDKELYISRILEYVKSPLVVSKEHSKLHVPFIHQIHLGYNSKHYNVLTDLSRSVITDEYEILSPKEIVMHHMTAVRFNKAELARKFQGHSHFMRQGKEHFNNYCESVMQADKTGEYNVLTEDKFNILNYWKNEFGELYKSYMGNDIMDMI